VLRALARTSVEGVWLTRIQFIKGKGDLALVGRATRAELVPVYLERLRSEEALRGREFSRLEVSRATPSARGDAPTGPGVVEFVLTSGEGPAK
jgi:hypothetical protein